MRQTHIDISKNNKLSIYRISNRVIVFILLDIKMWGEKAFLLVDNSEICH